MPDYPIGYEPIGTVAVFTSSQSKYGSSRHSTERALARFARRKVEAVAFTGTTMEHNQQLLRQAISDMDFDAIVLVGGDELINSALQETAGTGIPVGIIPSGAGNDIAGQLRIPMSPEAAAEVVADGFVTTTDLGRVTGPDGQQRYFGTVLCTGADAYAAHRAENASWAWGPQRWMMGFVHEMVHLKWRPYRIELEGASAIPFRSEYAKALQLSRDGVIGPDRRLVIERRMAMATFGNSRFYASGVGVCPRADHHDGLLDLTIIEKAPRWEYARTFEAFASGNHGNLGYISSYRCKRARVMVGDMDIPAYADGNPMVRMPLTVEAVEATSRYIVPAP